MAARRFFHLLVMEIRAVPRDVILSLLFLDGADIPSLFSFVSPFWKRREVEEALL